MSLVRQLWLAVILIMAMVLAGSLLVSMLSARGYLETQLHRKNTDNANSLALSMSQQAKDPVTIDLQVAALFDSGHYQSIAVLDPRGKTIAERIQDQTETTVPDWFTRVFPIQSFPGRAQVSDGWKQFGTVVVVSHNRFAHQALWNQLFKMGGWFLVAAILSGLAGMLLLRSIKRPLIAVVNQARAISERRFLTIDVPRTPELGSVAQAMNEMVGRVRSMLSEDAARLETLRQQLNHDAVTGLDNRNHFMSRLRAMLESDDAPPYGVLVLLRLESLTEINDRLGHLRANTFLLEIGAALNKLANTSHDHLTARLNGTDFALLAPNADDGEGLAQELAHIVKHLAEAEIPGITDVFHIGAIHYHRGDQAGEVLAAADQSLATAESLEPNACHIETSHKAHPIASSKSHWHALFADAQSEGRLKLVLYPVVGRSGQTLHQEGLIRLQTARNGEWLTAGDFMPMAARLNLTGPLDLGAVRHAIDLMQTQAGDLAVNLSPETIADWGFHNQITDLLRKHPGFCRRLWIEVPEYGALRQYDAFRDLCRTLKQLGCRIGIEHFGHHLSEIQQLSELGLDYLKIDASFVHDIDQNPGNQAFLGGLCRMAHGIGITVIATGVRNRAEQDKLAELGFDGATGPGVQAGDA